MVNRKQFIRHLALTGGVFALSPSLKAFTENNSKAQIGLIVNIIEKELKVNWQQTLKEVATIGYDYLEFNTIGNAAPAEIKTYLKSIGIKPLVAGDAMYAFKTPDKFEKMVNDARFYGQEYLACYWPWMDNGDNKKLDDFKAAADALNEAGRKCQENGLRLVFHNHNKEFVKVDDDQFGYDIIMQYTDKQYVSMLLDVYWATKGGADAKSIIKKYKGRIKMLHVKDMDNTPQQGMTCPGYGIIDFKSIFAEARKSGINYYTIEVDEFAKPMQCVADSYRFVNQVLSSI